MREISLMRFCLFLSAYSAENAARCNFNGQLVRKPSPFKDCIHEYVALNV